MSGKRVGKGGPRTTVQWPTGLIRAIEPCEEILMIVGVEVTLASLLQIVFDSMPHTLSSSHKGTPPGR